MSNDRRIFLKQIAGIGACAACSRSAAAQAIEALLREKKFLP